jgi:hypothetical protein
MIEDELGPQSIADDIRSQRARPMAKRPSNATLVVIVVALATLVVIWFI